MGACFSDSDGVAIAHVDPDNQPTLVWKREFLPSHLPVESARITLQQPRRNRIEEITLQVWKGSGCRSLRNGQGCIQRDTNVPCLEVLGVERHGQKDQKPKADAKCFHREAQWKSCVDRWAGA